MNVSKGIPAIDDIAPREYTEELIQKYFEYEIAQIMVRLLQNKGLISKEESIKISCLNKKFSPYIRNYSTKYLINNVFKVINSYGL